MASETIPADNLGDESQQWRRWVEESLKKQGKFSRNYGLHQKANDKQKDAFGRALREAGLSQSELDAAVKDAKRKPAAPANAQIATDAYLAADGTPQSRVSMSTDVVTVDVNGKSINVANYQLYGRRNVAGTPWRMLAERESPVLVFDPLPIGEEWQFKIHPVSAAGVVGEASAALLVTMARDTTPPGKPALVTVTQKLGVVTLAWTGKLASGASLPPDFSHATVYMSTTVDGAGAPVGNLVGAGDRAHVSDLPYGESRWFWVVAYDVSGNASEASDRAIGAAQRVVETDILAGTITDELLSQPVRDAIASGGGTMNYYQPDEPAGGTYAIGDTWFDSDGGYAISHWDGSEWVPAPLSNQAISNLDAGKISTGELDAARIGAKTITVEKLLVGNFQNLILDPALIEPIEKTWRARAGNIADWTLVQETEVSGSAIRVTANGTTKVLTSRNRVAVKAGERYAIGVQASVFSDWVGASPFIQVVFRDVNGVEVSGAGFDMNQVGTWFNYSHIITVPANQGIVTGEWEIAIVSTSTAGRLSVGKMYFRSAVTSEVIVDGAVKADHVAANSITGAKIVGGTIEGVHIKADTITGDKIKARSIVAEKVLVGTQSNLVADPFYEGGIGSGTAWTIETGSPAGFGLREVGGAWQTAMIWKSAATTGFYQGMQSQWFPVRSGVRLRFSVGMDYEPGWVGSAPFARILFTSSNSQTTGYVDITQSGGSQSWSIYSAEVLVPNGSTRANIRYYTSPNSAGTAFFALPRVAEMATAELIVDGAITASKIDANAINGKTITGALIRSAASGARTEMTNQGIQVLDGASNPLVRLGYGIATGMQVRNPNGGALIPLGPHVFGTQGFTKTNNLNVTAGASGQWGSYTDENLGPEVLASPTGRMLVFAQVNLSYNSALDTEFQIVADLSSASGSVRFIDHMPLYGGAMTHVAIVNVVAGRTYRPFFAIRGRSGTSGRVSAFVLRTMVAMPI